ncbi:hypothetical protein ACKKBG_A39070 [Auxenochlorella protothecoides x Auxenochlorella symbiontica]
MAHRGVGGLKPCAFPISVRASGSRCHAAPSTQQTGHAPFTIGTLEEACRSAERSLVQYRFKPAKAQAHPLPAWQRLRAIERELEGVSEAQHARLAGACSGSSPCSTLWPRGEGLTYGAWDAAATAPPPAPEGSGREVLLQGFNWESWRHGWYDQLACRAGEIADAGFTAVWLPPPTASVSPQGYLPSDLYDLDSAYGSEAALRSCVAALHSHGLLALGDVVLNHRCAERRGPCGRYNLFGGRLDWDAAAIVGDDAAYGGTGAPSSGAPFHAAPNIDHASPRVKADLCAWLAWLRSDVGLDGWRLDFVRGFAGAHVADYMRASAPRFAVGEFWDGLAYGPDGAPDHDQDAHRGRLLAWLNAAGGRAAAFDVTTKGVLQAALERGEHWRLRDACGRAPGLVGLWPSRAVTFVDNHDTGSSQGHWPFPAHAVAQGYAYCLTHPGTPCVFHDHFFAWGGGLRAAIRALLAARRRARVHCRSALRVLEARAGLYAAEVDAALVCKLGPEDWQPPNVREWSLSCWGDQWAVWERA